MPTLKGFLIYAQMRDLSQGPPLQTTRNTAVQDTVDLVKITPKQSRGLGLVLGRLQQVNRPPLKCIRGPIRCICPWCLYRMNPRR